MLSLRHVHAWAGLFALHACATTPVPLPDPARPDSTLWGDEYEGLAVDGGETVRTLPRGFNVEWVEGATQNLRVDAFAHNTSIHARSHPSGAVGSIVWRGDGRLREVVAGNFAPVVAEGALIGDPRAGGDLRASGTRRATGLTLRSSTSTWSSVRGGGILLGADACRASLGGWESHARARVAAMSFERRLHDGWLGFAAGTTGDMRSAATIFGAQVREMIFSSGELALSQGRARGVVRMVAGATSAIAIAGAGPAGDEPFSFARKERWGAALEHRDGWGWGASRAGLSTLTRRDAVSDIRRRRAFCDGEWRIAHDARLQLAARVTRETTTRPARGVLAALPSHEVSDEWRARAAVRVQSHLENDFLTENTYRLEGVQNGTGKPGIIATWAWRLQAGILDTRFSASAHALQSGQVVYATEAAPPGVVEYSPVTGKGASLAASVRLSLKHRVWLGGAWSQRPPGPSRLWITLGVRG